MQALRQLRFLLQKNFRLQFRRKTGTLIETLLPIFFFLVMVMIRKAIKTTSYPEETFPDLDIALESIYSNEICAAPIINGFAYSIDTNNGLQDQIEDYLDQKNFPATFHPFVPILKGILKCKNPAVTCISLRRFTEQHANGTYANIDTACFRNVTFMDYKDAVSKLEVFEERYPKQIYYTFGEEMQSNETAKKAASHLIADISTRLLTASGKRMVVREFENEGVMVENATTSSESVRPIGNIPIALFDRVAACIVFHTVDDTNFKYTIRMAADNGDSTTNSWFTANAFPRYMSNVPRHGRDSRYYLNSGFTQLQRALDTTYTNRMFLNHSKAEPAFAFTRIQQFAYKAYKKDTFLLIIPQFMPLLILLSYIYTAMMTVKELVYEKEQRLREAMRMMGLRDSMNTVAWFLKTLAFLSISLVLVTLLLKYGNITPNSNGFFLFLYLFLYGVSLISFCFLIASFFSKTKIVSFIAGIVYFMAYFPYFFLGQPETYANLQMSNKLSACLLAPTCMAFGSMLISGYESEGTGIRAYNLGSGSGVGDDFGMVHVYFMLIVDAVFYMALAWYFDKVVPKEYGTRLPFYFPLMRSYWFPTSHVRMFDGKQYTKLPGTHSDTAGGGDFEDFEDEPENTTAHICIENLRREFTIPKGIKTAVDNISMNMYEGHITALLGHNGAGKTTLISMLTGLIPPTSGTATIGGRDITTEMQAIRTSLGVCPQYDVVWDLMTVREHLIFYAQLKQVPTEEMAEEVDTMIRDIGLWAKRDTFSKDLSGGMRRRMSVGMALIGGSKTIILDEPTSGQDPHARRGTWDLLMKHKAGRTIILTTHFMDEADLLGDRIVIMASGQVKTAGSSLFLKQRFGKGYVMTLARAKNTSQHATSTTEIVRKHVKDAETASDVGTELAYRLPSSASSKFKGLFDDLDAHKSALGIDSYGLTLTTMEEVFLKVGKQDHDDDATDTQAETTMSRDTLPGPTTAAKAAFVVDMEPSDVKYALIKPGTMEMRWQHIKAMMLKRWWYTKRDYLAVIIQLVLPTAFVVLGLITALIRDPVATDPAVPLTGALYGLEPRPVLAVGSSTPCDDACHGIVASLEATGGDLAWDTLDEAWYRDAAFQDLASRQGLERAMQSQAIIAVTHNIRDRRRRPVGFGVDSANATARGWFSGEGYHDIPVSAGMLSSALASQVAGKRVRIVTENHPLPKSTSQDLDALQNSFLSFSIATCVMFGMAFLLGSFGIYLVMERHTGAKHLQFISGVNVYSYWCATFAFDLLNYILPVIVIILLFVGFNVSEYSGENIVGVFVLLMLYGFAALPTTYWISFMFKSEMTAYAMAFVLNYFIGLGTLFVTVLLDNKDLGAYDANQILKKIFLLFPSFALGQGLVSLYQNAAYRELCHHNNVAAAICADHDIEAVSMFSFDFPGIAPQALAMLVEGFVYFGFVFLIEADIFARFRKNAFLGTHAQADEDEDVANERQRVSSSRPPIIRDNGDMDVLPAMITDKGDDDAVVQLRGLFKQFPSKPRSAVDGLWLQIPRNECFGLVGVNGAGKTTTFKMLTGDITPTNGDAIMAGYSILTDMVAIRQKVGYCPQFDAIIGKLTGKEMLTMYAMMRGVPMTKISSLVAQSIRELDLERYKDMLCGTYSGGNKRKLSTAIALIGDPDILLLDEPSTGMDPGARRFIWDTINNALTARGGRSIVLTSHSMEECEALCSRLVVMVNGQFKCLGSLQHLKSRFGNGFNMMVKVDDTKKREQLCQWVAETFPGAITKEAHHTMAEFLLPNTSKWGTMFASIESVRNELGIVDYGISQPTLEQIFIGFAKSQLEEDQ